MKKVLSLILLFIGIQFPLFSQIDFNNYRTIKSEGTIPKDFSSKTYSKVEEDIKKGKEELSKSKEKIFFKNIHYGIDDILNSGLVTYGDEVSNYVQTIAQKLLQNDPSLFSKLRFYTIKSNETNALSTDQGIIFVTTGLISQLTSEAQLAFVIAHEISHYTSNHFVETFEFNNDRHSNIRNLSFYSKENEFEADKKGAKLYAEAGYDLDELMSSFDVLMYSYLPFDETEIPSSYFSSSLMYIPSKNFPDQKYEIKAIEDYSDEGSSHPNIKKRKDLILKESSTINNWKKNKYFFGEEKFLLLRNVCRFESIRTDILDQNYSEAIYSIFLLEKQFPNSIFLKRMKAQAWLGILQFKKNGKVVGKISESSFEGEIATVYFLFKKMTKEALITLAIRKVYDLKLENPADKYIDAVYKAVIKELVSIKGFKLESYSTKTFSEAASEFYNPNKVTTQLDTTIVNKKSSKYDKIKTKKSGDNIENFDTTKYYVYGISDVITDKDFLLEFKKELTNTIKNDENYNDKLSNKELANLSDKEQNELLKIGLKDVIIVEPMVFDSKKGKVDLVKSEMLKSTFNEAINDAATESGVNIYFIDSEHLDSNGTELFNQRNSLYAFITQLSNDENISVFPLDFEILNEMKNQYGTSKVLFTWVNHDYQSNVEPLAYWFLLVPPIYPALMIYYPIGILTGHRTNISFVLLDIENGTIDIDYHYFFKDTPKRLHLGAHVFNVFEKMKQSKNSK